MTTKNAAVLIVLYFADLKEESKGKEFLTLKDFKDEEQEECERDDVDIILYEAESKIRQVLLYNNDIDNEGQPAYETLEEDALSQEQSN